MNNFKVTIKSYGAPGIGRTDVGGGGSGDQVTVGCSWGEK
jgi:hypothetical protein